MRYCNWCRNSELNRRYHDEEWGIPVADDRVLFEFLMLEVLQCGLSWSTIISKRDIFRQCFAGFDYDKVAFLNDTDIERILAVPGMLRSRAKVQAVINNAGCFRKIIEEKGSFPAYLKTYTDGKTIIYHGHPDGFIPASNGLSAKISEDLKKRGFKYIGPVTVYAFLQACGVINDHDKDCPCFKKIIKTYPVVYKRRYLEKNVVHYSE